MSIHRRGKYWYYDFTVNNCRYRGACGTTKKSLADEIETKLKTDRQRAAIFGETAIITFVSAADEWMKAGREALYLAPLISHFGEKPITQITPEHVRDAAIALYPTQSKAPRDELIHLVFGEISAKSTPVFIKFDMPTVLEASR